MFKIGETVRCLTPVGELEQNKVYIVSDVQLPTTAVPMPENTQIFLRDTFNHYYAFRFERINQAPDITKVIAETVDFVNEDYNKYVEVAEAPPITANNGAAKNDGDKIDLSLIPAISNKEHARAFMVGESKYGRYNYCKGHKASQLTAAAKRHLDAWFDGEERDPVDGQHHLGSVMACCSMILRQEELGTLKDDRYFKPGTEEV